MARTRRGIGAMMRRRVKEQQGWECDACGWPDFHLEIHHKQAVSFGGTGVRSNLVGLCATCHALAPALAREYPRYQDLQRLAALA